MKNSDSKQSGASQKDSVSILERLLNRSRSRIKAEKTEFQKRLDSAKPTVKTIAASEEELAGAGSFISEAQRRYQIEMLLNYANQEMTKTEFELPSFVQKQKTKDVQTVVTKNKASSSAVKPQSITAQVKTAAQSQASSKASTQPSAPVKAASTSTQAQTSKPVERPVLNIVAPKRASVPSSSMLVLSGANSDMPLLATQVSEVFSDPVRFQSFQVAIEKQNTRLKEARLKQAKLADTHSIYEEEFLLSQAAGLLMPAFDTKGQDFHEDWLDQASEKNRAIAFSASTQSKTKQMLAEQKADEEAVRAGRLDSLTLLMSAALTLKSQKAHGSAKPGLIIQPEFICQDHHERRSQDLFIGGSNIPTYRSSAVYSLKPEFIGENYESTKIHVYRPKFIIPSERFTRQATKDCSELEQRRFSDPCFSGWFQKTSSNVLFADQEPIESYILSQIGLLSVMARKTISSAHLVARQIELEAADIDPIQLRNDTAFNIRILEEHGFFPSETLYHLLGMQVVGHGQGSTVFDVLRKADKPNALTWNQIKTNDLPPALMMAHLLSAIASGYAKESGKLDLYLSVLSNLDLAVRWAGFYNDMVNKQDCEPHAYIELVSSHDQHLQKCRTANSLRHTRLSGSKVVELYNPDATANLEGLVQSVTGLFGSLKTVLQSHGLYMNHVEFPFG